MKMGLCILFLGFSGVALANDGLRPVYHAMNALQNEPLGMGTQACSSVPARDPRAPLSCVERSAQEWVVAILGNGDACRGPLAEDWDSVYQAFASVKLGLKSMSSGEYLDLLNQYVSSQDRLSGLEKVALYAYFQMGYFYVNRALGRGGEEARCISPLTDALVTVLRG
jgi:hypothetical protein